jgi:hypothetical protein
VEYQNMDNIAQAATQLEENLRIYGYNVNNTTLTTFLHVVLKNWQEKIPKDKNICTIFGDHMENRMVMDRYSTGQNKLQACKKARGWLRTAPKRYKYNNIEHYLEFIWMLRAELGPNGRVILDTIAVNLDVILDPRNYNSGRETEYEYSNHIYDWKLKMFSSESTTKKRGGVIKISKIGKPSSNFLRLCAETDNALREMREINDYSSGFDENESD